VRFPPATASYETVPGLACLPVPDIMTGKMPVLLSAIGRVPIVVAGRNVRFVGRAWFETRPSAKSIRKKLPVNAITDQNTSPSSCQGALRGHMNSRAPRQAYRLSTSSTRCPDVNTSLPLTITKSPSLRPSVISAWVRLNFPSFIVLNWALFSASSTNTVF